MSLFGGVKLTDESEMPMGKHKGTPMANVPAHHLRWLSEQDWISKYPELQEYITENKDVIDQELKED